MLITLLSRIYSWLEGMSPLITNLAYAWGFYLAVDCHAYGYLVAVATYVVLGEFDTVKRDILKSQRQAIQTR